MQITLREYQKEDFKVLENIIRETWHYDEFSSPRTAVKLARVFLSSCLTNHTFSRVALMNDKPIGIILVKNIAIHRCPLKYRLKQMNMSIEEIEAYRKNPTNDSFLKIANSKIKEIDVEIQKLKTIKKILQAKKDSITLCENLQEQTIRIEEYPSESILFVPIDFDEADISELFVYLKDIWSMEQIRMGIGGVISLDKVINENFEKYDGLYTPALRDSSSTKKRIKPKGKYLCGYQKGTWDKLPCMYKKMIDYAKQNNLILTGYAYEIGLNEFAISDSEEYVTKIMIKIQDNS